VPPLNSIVFKSPFLHASSASPTLTSTPNLPTPIFFFQNFTHLFTLANSTKSFSSEQYKIDKAENASRQEQIAPLHSGATRCDSPEDHQIGENKPSRTEIATLALEQGSRTVYENLRIFGGEFWPARRVRDTGCRLRSQPRGAATPPWSVNSALQHSSTPPGKRRSLALPTPPSLATLFPTTTPTTRANTQTRQFRPASCLRTAEQYVPPDPASLQRC
jgi:hypothetical protein